ncbi:MAG: SDR family oxidoreductase [Methylophilus sp.]|nr:SDR family oxidoreductase [Methylophilus sp.]
MARVLLVGCGDLGTAMAMQLHEASHEVVGVRKSAQPLPLEMLTLQLDVTQADTVKLLEQISPEIIIYCVAATAQTDENYYLHYVLGLHHVLLAQANNPNLKHVFFVSSTRVYGQHSDDVIDEGTPAKATDFGGHRLLEAEQLLQNLPCQSTVLRLSGIYGPGRLYLVNMAKDITRWPKENHWSNRIHRDDAANFIVYLVNLALNGQSVHPLYIVTDAMPTAQYDVLSWIANRMSLPQPQKLNHAVIQGKRLSNRRLVESGYQLKYPNYQIGYAELV